MSGGRRQKGPLVVKNIWLKTDEMWMTKSNDTFSMPKKTKQGIFLHTGQKKLLTWLGLILSELRSEPEPIEMWVHSIYDLICMVQLKISNKTVTRRSGRFEEEEQLTSDSDWLSDLWKITNNHISISLPGPKTHTTIT